ncbi:MAG: thioesterase family protein [Sneathiella sp.]|uniref:acyl-CoA thioesterase n=1 Tax=Sneathiella sp. TaxID=1964365 RepID=UPI00300153AB
MARSDFSFFFDFRVRYSEIDGQGVVFNAHYLTYFDTAITEYFRHLGFDYRDYVAQTGQDFHLVKSLVNYEKPILFDADIEVGCRVSNVGRTSITFLLEIFGKGNDTRYSNGEIIWVNTDQATHKTAPVNDEIRALFGHTALAAT